MGTLRLQRDMYNEIDDMIKFLQKRNYAPFAGNSRLDLTLWSLNLYYIINLFKNFLIDFLKRKLRMAGHMMLYGKKFE